MPTRRKREQQSRGKAAPRPSKAEADDTALAEELIRTAQEQQADFVAGWDKFMKGLGIRGKPIGAKKLRERLIQEGFDPEGTEFSRGIIAMREE